MKESGTTSHVRWFAAQQGLDLWRNNSGAWKDPVTGRVIWYGLGSFKEKDELKSGDYVGITPLLIEPKHLYTTIGVFTNVEMKHSDWKFYQSDKTALHQQNFHDIVRKGGGYAGFARNEQDLLRIIHREKN